MRRPPSGRLAAPAVLAVPFLVTIALLNGLRTALPMFHGSDEFHYHYPTILRFARQLPFPDLDGYHAAQTPLFHLLLAYIGKLAGYELWRLRLVEVLISYGLALALFGLLHRRLGVEYRAALALTLLFTLSPYVFAPSFRLMTDNLALLLVVLALDRLEAFRRGGGAPAFAAAVVCTGAAILARQSSAFMVGVELIYLVLMAPGQRWRPRMLELAALAASLAPAAVLFASWHGLVPPAGDQHTCGLCSVSGAGTALTYHTAEVALAALGLYGTVLFAPALLSGLRAAPRRLWPLGAGALGGAVLVAVCPSDVPRRIAGTDPAAGLIWRAAQKAPHVLGSSLVFWVLVPLGVGVVAWRLDVTERDRRITAGAFLACFLLGTLAVRIPWQKYVDPFALIGLLLTVRPREFPRPAALAGVALLALGAIAYAVSFTG